LQFILFFPLPFGIDRTGAKLHPFLPLRLIPANKLLQYELRSGEAYGKRQLFADDRGYSQLMLSMDDVAAADCIATIEFL